jgi:hypothetical protein
MRQLSAWLAAAVCAAAVGCGDGAKYEQPKNPAPPPKSGPQGIKPGAGSGPDVPSPPPVKP